MRTYFLSKIYKLINIVDKTIIKQKLINKINN